MDRERLERYSLTGPENQAAVQAELAGGDWFRSAVPRKRMKDLMRRSDYPAIRDTIIWLGLMGLFAGLGIAFWGSWRALPFFLAYGLLYGSTSDSRWHETGHGTAFWRPPNPRSGPRTGRSSRPCCASCGSRSTTCAGSCRRKHRRTTSPRRSTTGARCRCR